MPISEADAADEVLGRIAGRVTDTEGNGLIALVELYSSSGYYILHTFTDNNGEYLFTELVEGSYPIKFSGLDESHMSEWYK